MMNSGHNFFFTHEIALLVHVFAIDSLYNHFHGGNSCFEIYIVVIFLQIYASFPRDSQ